MANNVNYYKIKTNTVYIILNIIIIVLITHNYLLINLVVIVNLVMYGMERNAHYVRKIHYINMTLFLIKVFVNVIIKN